MRAYTTSTGMGRKWPTFLLRMAERSTSLMSKTFSTNLAINVKTVFSGAYNGLNTISGGPSTVVDSFHLTIPFSSDWFYSGSSVRAIIADMRMNGGTLNNSGAWSATAGKSYYIDGALMPPTSASNSVIAYGSTTCKASGMTISTYCYPSLTSYAPITGSTTTGNKIYVGAYGYTRKGGSAIYAYSALGSSTGLFFPALCNRLHVIPAGFLFVATVAPSSTSGYKNHALGYFPYKSSYVGSSLWTQAAFVDPVSFKFTLSRAGRRVVAQQPAKSNFWAVYDNYWLGSTSDINPSSFYIYNPIRKYWF